MRSKLRIALSFGALLLLLTPLAAAASEPEQKQFLSQVAFDQRLNEQVPLDIPFVDEEGNSVRLGDYFVGKPVIMLLGYYNCPNLCPLTREGVVESLSRIDFTAGDEYELLLVSIDPKEGPAAAALTKTKYVDWYDRPGAAGGMHFLTGEEEAIETLSKAVGFRYGYDAGSEQYAHASGITVLTPAGTIARYLFGIEFDPRDLRLALVDAAANRIGSPIDKLLLLCFHYDPSVGKYTFAIMNVIRVAGTLTVLVLGGFIFYALRSERDGGAPPGPQQAAT